MFAATGHHCHKRVWYLGNTVDEELAIARWADQHAPGSYVQWYKVQHPQLGEVELGGPDQFRLVINPPTHLLREEVTPHAEFAVRQAMMSPKLEIIMTTAACLGPYGSSEDVPHNIGGSTAGLYLWQIKIGTSNMDMRHVSYL